MHVSDCFSVNHNIVNQYSLRECDFFWKRGATSLAWKHARAIKNEGNCSAFNFCHIPLQYINFDIYFEYIPNKQKVHL